jgi:hypothetical protein
LVSNLTLHLAKKGPQYYVVILTPLLLIINLGLGSQLDPITVAGFPLNQIINWLVIFGAAIIVKNSYHNNVFPIIIILVVVFSKVVSVLLGRLLIIEVVYYISMLLLFVLMGVVYIHKYLDLIYKQIMVLCLLNVIMMFFQVIDFSDWTHILYSAEIDVISYDILFVPLKNFQYSIFQGRPPGFLRANVILGGLLLFGLALHFSRVNNRVWWGTFTLSAMIILAGANLGYVGYLIIVLFLTIKGNRIERVNVIYSIITMLLLLRIHYFLFPGLFENFWSFGHLSSSYFIRINGIIDLLETQNVFRILLESRLEGTSRTASEGEGSSIYFTSGYLQILHYLPYLIPLLLISFYVYIKSFRKFIYFFPHLSRVTTLSLLMFLLYPAAVPILQNQFYWLIGGFALSPILISIPPDYNKYKYEPNRTLTKLYYIGS